MKVKTVGKIMAFISRAIWAIFYLSKRSLELLRFKINDKDQRR